MNEDGNKIENKLEAMEYTAKYYEDLYQARKEMNHRSTGHIKLNITSKS